MKRLFAGIIIGIVIAAIVLVSVTVFAQDGIAAFVRPLIVDIKQVVPVLADVVVPLEDGTMVTATVPLTINVALQVSLSGVVSDSVKVVEETEPVVITKTPVEVQPTANDSTINGVQWTIESIDRLGTKMDLGAQDNLKFETRGEFVIVHIVLENVSDKPVPLYTDFNVELVDESDRAFAPVVVGYALDQLCSSMEINPGIETPCEIPFEMPKGAKGLRLRISDENNRVVELIVPEE